MPPTALLCPSAWAVRRVEGAGGGQELGAAAPRSRGVTPCPQPASPLPGAAASLSKYKFINSLINHTSYLHRAFKNKTFESSFTPTLGLSDTGRSYHPRLRVRTGGSASEPWHVGVWQGSLVCRALSLPLTLPVGSSAPPGASLQNKSKRATRRQSFWSSREKKRWSFSHSANTPSVSQAPSLLEATCKYVHPSPEPGCALQGGWGTAWALGQATKSVGPGKPPGGGGTFAET